MQRRSLSTILGVAAILAAAVLAASAATANEYSGLANPEFNYTAPGYAPGVAPVNTTRMVPAAPSRPSAPSRPDTWPGTAPQTTVSTTSAPPITEAIPCEDAQIVARVGSEVILASDVMAYLARTVLDPETGIHGKRTSQMARAAWQILNRSPADGPLPEQYRTMLLRGGLREAMEFKLVFLDAKREIPDENLPSVEAQLDQYFEESELPMLIRGNRFASRQELDDAFRRLGSSLEAQKRIFRERSLAMQWIRGQTNVNKATTHEEMLAYYQEHLADFEHPARAKWEQISVRISKHPNREAAYAALAALGNRVQDGELFAEVAQQGSDGPTASRGGARDWTTQGSLISKALDHALFALPVGQLSPILEDEKEFHIIRVVEREPAHRTPFETAQADIKAALLRERGQDGVKDYLARLKAETPTSTIFDEPSQRETQSDAAVARRPTEEGMKR